jgi:hypothetical protein
MALLLGITMLTAGISKLSGDGTPAWFVTQFQGTFLNFSKSALAIQFYLIATVEILIGIAALLSIFLKTRKLNLLETTCFISMLLFGALAFGQRITFNFQDSAILFFYAATCLVFIHLLKNEQSL